MLARVTSRLDGGIMQITHHRYFASAEWRAVIRLRHDEAALTVIGERLEFFTGMLYVPPSRCCNNLCL
jgi:hypothetical protein